MAKYFINGGCYLGSDNGVFEFDSQEEAEQAAYEMAKEETEAWVGSHGFCDEEPESFDTEKDYEDYVREVVENECDYYAEIYVPSTHDAYMV